MQTASRDPVEDNKIMCRSDDETASRRAGPISEAESERRFATERERYRLEEERIWQECLRMEDEYFRPRGILGRLGYRTSVPGF